MADIEKLAPHDVRRRCAPFCHLAGGELIQICSTNDFPILISAQRQGVCLPCEAALLHVAAEFPTIHAARLLLDRGADVNATAMVDETGIGGQTPIFYAATQGNDARLSLVKLLVDQGADLTVRAKVPENPSEVLERTPLEYALRFPGNLRPTSMHLKENAAIRRNVESILQRT